MQDELNQIKIQADVPQDGNAWETELDDSNIQRQILQNDLETRCSQLEECRRHADELRSRLDQVLVKDAEMERQNEALAAHQRAAEEKFERLSEKFKKLAANYKQKLAVIQQLEKKLEAFKNAASKSASDPQALMLKLIQAEDDVKVLRDQLENAKETADNLKQTQALLKKAEAELLASGGELQSTKLQFEELAQVHRGVVEQLEEARAQVSCANSAVLELQSALEEERRNAEQRDRKSVV